MTAPSEAARTASYRDPTLLVPRQRWLHWEWILILLAVLGDLAAFYSVLGLLFETSPVVVGFVAAGFTAGAIGIACAIGTGLARRRCADPRASLPLLASCLAAWTFLGLAAFMARYRFGPESTSATSAGGSAVFPSTGGTAAPATTPDTDQALISAMVFAALFVVSGLCAIYAAFHAHNPYAGAHSRAIRNLDKTVAVETKSRARLERAEQVLRAGRSVVLDATFRARAQREQARELAARLGVDVVFAECRCPRDAAIERLRARAREPQVSDGREEIFDSFAASFESVDELPPVQHVVVDTTRPHAEALSLALASLGFEGASRLK